MCSIIQSLSMLHGASVLVGCISVLLAYRIFSPVSCPVCTSASPLLNGPHSPSWSTWFHPERLNLTLSPRQVPDWNILHHMGGNGPWVQRESSGLLDISPPEKCTVEQVHLLSRHSERYPTRKVGESHLALVKRLKDLDVPLNGSLAFFNNWTYFSQDTQGDFEQLTSTGPYAGTLSAFTTGTRFRTRYGHLLPPDSKTIIWASDSQRVIDTAKYFVSGLFGYDWETAGKAEVQIIPETVDRHTDTLTPGDSCVQFIEDKVFGHDYGKNMLAKFQDAYLPPIMDRLIREENNTALGNFSAAEGYSMQEMCGFETMIRGSSPWCEVFTEEDWEQYEYARDILQYYRAGPGNKYAAVMGSVYLRATALLLRAGPNAGRVFFSFVHDGDIAPVLTALDLFHDAKYDPNLPVTHVAKDRRWKVSTVMPMGGRVTFELLRCMQTSKKLGEYFVRININDAIIPLPGCDSGPGKSCPLNRFLKGIADKQAKAGKFARVCKTSADDTGITFLRQPGFNV